MTKEAMTKKIEGLIDKTEGLIKEVNKVVVDCSDSPAVTGRMGYYYESLVMHLGELNRIKKEIDEYSDEEAKASKLLAPYPYMPTEAESHACGYTFSKEEKGDE